MRQGRWQRLFPGTYVVHNGPVSWRTRASAALLYAGSGAALSHRSAAFVYEFIPREPRVIDVSVPETRRVSPQRGLRIHRRRRMPPAYGALVAVNPADTAVDVAQRCERVDDVVGIVCAAVRLWVRPAQVARAVVARGRLRHRALLLEIVAEVADGVESPLERRFHRDVERAHGLPRSRLQKRERLTRGWIRADALYEGLGVRVELDGALAHPGGRTDDDTWRDNAVLIERGDLTLRYRWRHVASTPCEAAAQVAAALRARGWTGRARPCGPGCALAPR